MISSESAIVSLIELTPTTAPTNPLATATQAASEMGPVTSEKAFSGILTRVLEPAPAAESALPEPHSEETYFAEEVAPEAPSRLSEVFAAVEETTFSAPAPEAPVIGKRSAPPGTLSEVKASSRSCSDMRVWVSLPSARRSMIEGR